MPVVLWKNSNGSPTAVAVPKLVEAAAKTCRVCRNATTNETMTEKKHTRRGMHIAIATDEPL